MHRAAISALSVLLGAVMLAFVFTLGYVINDDESGTGSRASEQRDTTASDTPSAFDFETLDEIVDILEKEYVDQDQLDDQALYEAAITGLLGVLPDTGTFYIDPTSYQLSIGPSGAFEGIGATVQERDGEITIVRPIDGSPAEAAGIQSLDVILAVDGESTEGWSVDRAVLRIRGEKGTDVTLTIRSADGETRDVVITRDTIQLLSVSTTPPGSKLLDADGNEAANIAYIRISEFMENTPEEVAEAAQEAEESGMEGLIIDLRGNPGGLLQETVDTADLFLDSGIILIEVDRDGSERTFRAREGGVALDIPIVILQDENSASGSEVLAAALQDNDRATLIGEVSFGKGTVNIARELGDGGALFVSIATWQTPDGLLIEGVGILPDIEVDTPSPYEPQYSAEADAMIHGAIDHLRSFQASEDQDPSSGS